METHDRELLERGVAALEALAKDPVIEIEGGPPICPHCNTVNPEVEIREEGGRGPLAECFIEARALCCQRLIFAIPQIWRIFPTLQELEIEMSERGGNNGS